MSKQLIGTTSWLVPGTYYENARLVAQIVDFVELLVYTWDEKTIQLIHSEIDKLNSLTEKFDLFYTVHLPTDNAENAISAYDYFSKSKLKILNYVLHPMDGAQNLLYKHAKQISLENLKEKIEYHQNMTFDVGHHILGKKFPREFVKNVKEIHLMGVTENKDHLRLNERALNEVKNLFKEKIKKVPLLCFEVFDIKDMIDSVNFFVAAFDK